jgi:signal transduction histidine kinase
VGTGLTNLFKTRDRRLMFRSYLTLVGGLLAVAVVLDFGFDWLQSREQPDTNRWLASTFGLIESRLASVPAAERDAVAAEIAEELHVGVQILTRDAVYVNETAEHGLLPLVDSDGNTSWLHDAAAIDSIIRLGPIAEPQTSRLLNLLPPLFYLSILVVVGLWLRPLLKDIGVISAAAQRFAVDYREPLETAEKTTELKPLARNLDAMAARLSGVLRSQKELIAALSHEMRTPLARLRFALAVGEDGADAELRERLSAMNKDVQEIDDLIASMLNFARLDHPDITMHWQDVPGEPWLGAIIAKFDSAGARIELCAERVPEEVRMDPRLMELAFNNLLVNALKYAARTVHCCLEREANRYRLTVEDDGPGIPEESREEIFRAFTRIDDSRSRETGGSGLGLAIVARVADLHAGSACADSSPGLGGARISIVWPVQGNGAAAS